MYKTGLNYILYLSISDTSDTTVSSQLSLWLQVWSWHIGTSLWVREPWTDTLIKWEVATTQAVLMKY